MPVLVMVAVHSIFNYLKMKNNLILFIIMLIQINVFSQNINKDIRQGVKLYEDSSYVEAEQKFRNALQKDQDSFVSSFNLADAIYKQENYEKSESLFKALAEKAETKEEKSMSYHNFGNSLFKQEKIKESVEAYKNALISAKKTGSKMLYDDYGKGVV